MSFFDNAFFDGAFFDVGAASVDATATGSIASSSLTAPTATATGTANATASGTLSASTLSAPTAAATGSAAASGALSAATLTAPTGTASGGAVATGAIAGVTLVAPTSTLTKARPFATVTPGLWAASAPGDLHSMINNSPPDDSTYVVATAPTVSRYALSSVTLPALVRRGLTYRASGATGGLAVRLYQGATVVSQRLHSSLPATVTQYTMLLDDTELALVVDGSDLFVELEALEGIRLTEDNFIRTTESGEIRISG